MKEDQLQEGGGRGLFTLKNLILLLIGFVLGYIIKGQATQNITMGYDDYKIIVNEKIVETGTEIKSEELNNQNNVTGEDVENAS
jgi:hypothetical protein